MDIEVIRLECLKMAIGFGAATPEQIVEHAQKLTDFIANGKSEPPRDHGQES